jgi:hypothetical protein
MEKTKINAIKWHRYLVQKNQDDPASGRIYRLYITDETKTCFIVVCDNTKYYILKENINKEYTFIEDLTSEGTL